MTAAHALLLAGLLAALFFSAGVRIGRQSERANRISRRRQFERSGYGR